MATLKFCDHPELFIMLGEINQTQKNQVLHNLTYMWNLEKKKISTHTIRGWGLGGDIDQRVPFFQYSQGEYVLET